MANMQVKRYEAVDMGEALKMIKSDLGPEAVILTTRQVKKGGGSFGLFARPLIEVTAAIPVARRSEPKRARHFSGAGSVDSGMVDTRAIMEGTVAVMEPLLDGLDEIRRSLATFSMKDETAEGASERIGEEVRELKSMIYHLIDQSAIEKERGMGKNYLALIRILKDKGIATEYAQAMVDEIKEKADGAAEPDLRTLLNLVAVRMRDAMMFGGAITPSADPSERPSVLALVGPTGVGKTTTIAKIAAKLSMDGMKVGLCTIDTFRIAAVEQLKIYAKILNIPLEVILTPHDLGRCLHMFKGMDVVMIDTAGRSQRDMEQIDELNKFIGGSLPVETRLVLSASSSERQMEEAIKNFSAIPIGGLVFTKLDEAVNLGAVFNQHVKTGLPISYFTTGQKVPEDIEEATAKRLINGLFRP